MIKIELFFHVFGSDTEFLHDVENKGDPEGGVDRLLKEGQIPDWNGIIKGGAEREDNEIGVGGDRDRDIWKGEKFRSDADSIGLKDVVNGTAVELWIPLKELDVKE